jgi:hypothetical protein
MKYAVAHMDFFINDLKIAVVDADDPITAIVEGVLELLDTAEESMVEWVESFRANIPQPCHYGKRIEEIKQEFFDGDQLVAVAPV